jgi:hypothetical protein
MADPTTHPDFDLDTAVSADLDGELSAYADELGVTPDELRAALGSPAAVERRAALAGARDTLRADTGAGPDELTRRRLLASAGVGAGRDRGIRRTGGRDGAWWLRVGAAAAVTLVVVGALYALVGKSDDSGDRGAKASGGGSAATRAVTGDLGDLGVVDAAEVSRLLRGDRPAASDGAQFSTAAPEGNGAKADTSARSSSPTAAPVAPSAVEACAGAYGTAGSIRFRATGSYGGRGAVVLGIDTGGRTIVFIVAADDCTQVLYSASR